MAYKAKLHFIRYSFLLRIGFDLSGWGAQMNPSSSLPLFYTSTKKRSFMVSYIFAQQAESVVHRFADDTYIIQRLRQLSDLYEEVSPELAATLINIQQSVGKCQVISKKVDEGVSAIKKGTKASRLFTEIRDAISHAEQFSEQMPSQSFNVKEHLEDFNEAYDTYIDNQRPDTAFKLMIQGYRSYAAISTFRDTLQQIAATITSETNKPNDDEHALVLYFPQQIQLDTLVIKLSAIQALYDDLLDMAGLTTSAHPLRIVKVETGSFFVKLIGALLPVKLIGDFTRKTAEILFRRFVTEGKIEAEADYRKEIVETLNLRNALQDAGIDTSKIDNRLAHAANKHADHLCKLMYGESSVEIDGVAISIGDMQEAQFLEQKELLRLESSADNANIQSTPKIPNIEGPSETGGDS